MKIFREILTEASPAAIMPMESFITNSLEVIIMVLGAPTYSFQYNNQTPGVGGGSRTIANLNLNTEINDDGITPAAWIEFINGVFAELGITFGTTYPKIVETRAYELE